MPSNEQEYRDKIKRIISHVINTDHVEVLSIVAEIATLSSSHFATPKMEGNNRQAARDYLHRINVPVYDSIADTMVDYANEVQPLLSASTQIGNELSGGEIDLIQQALGYYSESCGFDVANNLSNKMELYRSELARRGDGKKEWNEQKH